MSRQTLKNTKRWVIKIGSALLTNDGAGLNKEGITHWVDQIAFLKSQGIEVCIGFIWFCCRRNDSPWMEDSPNRVK